jgi:hypothetical protein
MEKFNPFLFVETLEKEIIDLIGSKTNLMTDYDEIQDYISQEIDTACIYYSDCFAIVMALGVTDFGGCTNITELAYQSLYEFVQCEIDMHKLTELL